MFRKAMRRIGRTLANHFCCAAVAPTKSIRAIPMRQRPRIAANGRLASHKKDRSNSALLELETEAPRVLSAKTSSQSKPATCRKIRGLVLICLSAVSGAPRHATVRRCMVLEGRF
jgi:hypothetical protein